MNVKKLLLPGAALMSALLLTFSAFSLLASEPPEKKPTPPDEGMWIPLLISQNFQEMQNMGLKLTPEQIYSVNNSSLKDAVVWFGGFCTGEIISDNGLILTNHHCGYGSIQELSSTENNYLRDGFWAKNHGEELPAKGLFVRFLVRIEDVTSRIRPQLKGLDGMERALKENQLIQQVVEQASEGNDYEAQVKSMYFGDEYYLYVYETYRDIRLVGTPPESVGKYGGDTDNWMWPRHTGDFSMFRVYAGPGGKPAEYSPSNRPLRPKHSLKVSIKDREEGEYTMIMGFPGRTERYLTSDIIRMRQYLSNPSRVKLRDARLKLWKSEMDKSERVDLMYSSKYARIANYWKYFQGQTKGLIRLNTIALKEEEEQVFKDWAAENPKRKEKYGGVIENVADAVNEFRPYNASYVYFREALYAPEIVTLAAKFREFEAMLGSESPPDLASFEAAQAGLREEIADYFKDYHAPADQKVLAALYKMYHKDVPRKQHPKIFKKIERRFKGDFDRFAAEVFEKSIFANEATLLAFVDSPDLRTLQRDWGYMIAQSVLENYIEVTLPRYRSYKMKVDDNLRLYVQGMREMNPKKTFYPDANSCMRLTYGRVLDYVPMDAVQYDYYTTLEGVAQKADPNNPEFIVPEKLMELHEAKDYGRWANAKGELPVCFICNTDITGGNSGSPVMNGKGELIGLAFDGNWEAMTGDLVFDKELKRTINVDIRYVLFIIDKYAGADNIIKELKIVE